MVRAKIKNVIDFASRAEAIRQSVVDDALAQRAKEVRFKETVTGKKKSAEELTEVDLVATAQSIVKSSDTFRNCLKFWERLAKSRENQLKRANRKIAKLERELATARVQSA